MVNLLQTRSSAVAKRPRDASCLSVVSFNSTKRQAQSCIILWRNLNYVLFSSAYSLVRGFLCRKQTCTVTVCDTPLDGPSSVDSSSSSRHRSIAGYRPTIVLLIAADRRSVHSMRLSHILGQNPKISAYPRAFDAPVGWGGGFRQNICCEVYYEKI